MNGLKGKICYIFESNQTHWNLVTVLTFTCPFRLLPGLVLQVNRFKYPHWVPWSIKTWLIVKDFYQYFASTLNSTKLNSCFGCYSIRNNDPQYKFNLVENIIKKLCKGKWNSWCVWSRKARQTEIKIEFSFGRNLCWI